MILVFWVGSCTQHGSHERQTAAFADADQTLGLEWPIPGRKQSSSLLNDDCQLWVDSEYSIYSEAVVAERPLVSRRHESLVWPMQARDSTAYGGLDVSGVSAAASNSPKTDGLKFTVMGR